MKKILFLSSGEGHKSLELATKNFLKNYGFQTHTFRTESAEFNFYKLFYRYKPSLFKYVYNLASKKQTYLLLKEYYKRLNQKHVDNIIKEFNPDIIITTHFSFLIANLDKYYEKIPVINITENPRNIVSFEVSKRAFSNCVFDQKQKQFIIDNFHFGHNIDITGWFVRGEFEKYYNKQELIKELGFKNKKIILFSTGSDGTNSIIINLLKSIEYFKDYQIIVACGHNKLLYRFFTVFKSVNNIKNLYILPFTKQIYKYIQIADVVIGKAGPNSIFEATATLTPFIGTTYIEGVERPNIEIIKEYKIGFFVQESEKIIEKILYILENNDLELFENIKRLREYNKKAKQKLLKIVKKALN